MANWKIDTMDARGGLAFASLRESDDLSGNLLPTASQGCVFIGAPDFLPEPVSDRALGLAAGRGAFQRGLFNENREEVSFRSPTEISEFVRRAFLRGSGGDDSDGDGGEPPPETPVDAPDFPEIPRPGDSQNERSLRTLIGGSLDKFAYLIGTTKPGQSTPTPWVSEKGKAPDISDRFSDGADILAAGALRMVHEMLRRFPTANQTAALERWQRVCMRFGHTLDRLELWPILLSGKYFSTLLQSLRYVASQRTSDFPFLNYAHFPDPSVGFLLDLIFRQGFPLDASTSDWEDLIRLWYGDYRRRFHEFRLSLSLSRGNSFSEGDPMSDLSLLPCPAQLEEIAGRTHGEPVNLYHLLGAFLGSPSAASAVNKAAAIDIVLFAGAVVVGHRDGPGLQDSRIPWSSHSISPTQRVALNKLASDAWFWILEHLPTLAFSREVEDAILSTAKLRYQD